MGEGATWSRLSSIDHLRRGAPTPVLALRLACTGDSSLSRLLQPAGLAVTWSWTFVLTPKMAKTVAQSGVEALFTAGHIRWPPCWASQRLPNKP